MTKKEFFENGDVMRLAGDLESCLKVCYHTYIHWEILVGYLWKNAFRRHQLMQGVCFGMADVDALAKELLEKFNAYFVVRLR